MQDLIPLEANEGTAAFQAFEKLPFPTPLWPSVLSSSTKVLSTLTASSWHHTNFFSSSTCLPIWPIYPPPLTPTNTAHLLQFKCHHPSNFCQRPWTSVALSLTPRWVPLPVLCLHLPLINETVKNTLDQSLTARVRNPWLILQSPREPV